MFSLFLLALALITIWMMRHYSPHTIRHWVDPVPLETPFDLLVLIASVVLAMLLHEAGHLLVAVALNFRVLGCVVGPLHLQHLHSEWKASWSLNTFFTGSISAVPGTMNHWRRSIIVVVVAGPAATLATGIAAATLHPLGHTQTLFQVAFVQLSLLLFVLGLLPNSRHARLSNDARLLLDLMRRNDGAAEMELKVLLKQQVLAGVRPQDYARDLILRLAAWRGRPESQLAFAQAIALWALDSDQPDLADLWDGHALEIASQCGARLKNGALASSACIDVLVRQDLQSARSKFAKVNFGWLFPLCFEHRSRAAQQIALGRLQRAPAHIIRAQYSLPRGIETYNMERMLLEKLHMQVLMPKLRASQKFKSASA